MFLRKSKECFFMHAKVQNILLYVLYLNAEYNERLLSLVLKSNLLIIQLAY